MINGDRPKLGPNAGRQPERSVLRALGAASDALACCTAGAQTRASANGIRGIQVGRSSTTAYAVLFSHTARRCRGSHIPISDWRRP
jgi:hypothetical protein